LSKVLFKATAAARGVEDTTLVIGGIEIGVFVPTVEPMSYEPANGGVGRGRKPESSRERPSLVIVGHGVVLMILASVARRN
jgi:hypothetical protein